MNDTIRRATVEERLINSVAGYFGVANDVIEKDKTLDAHGEKLFSQSGIDSLEKVEIVMCVEDEFGIEITDEDAERLYQQPLSAWVEHITKALAA